MSQALCLSHANTAVNKIDTVIDATTYIASSLVEEKDISK